MSPSEPCKPVLADLHNSSASIRLELAHRAPPLAHCCLATKGLITGSDRAYFWDRRLDRRKEAAHYTGRSRRCHWPKRVDPYHYAVRRLGQDHLGRTGRQAMEFTAGHEGKRRWSGMSLPLHVSQSQAYWSTRRSRHRRRPPRPTPRHIWGRRTTSGWSAAARAAWSWRPSSATGSAGPGRARTPWSIAPPPT